MAYRQKTSQDTTTSIPGGVPTIGKVISLIKQQINNQQFDFYELETFEVTKVLVDYEDLPKQKDGHPDYSYYGAVAGRFVVNKSQTINEMDKQIYYNLSNAEGTSGTKIFDFCATGFKARGNATDTNSSGSTYIYYAVAENPTVTSTGIAALAR